MKITWLMISMLFFCFCTGCAANSHEGSISSMAEVQRKETEIMPTQKGITEAVKLNSGYSMPVLGLGTWTLQGDSCTDAVYAAIKCGYRLIDTARYYGNEDAVGKGVRKAIDEGILKREEIFITSKIMPGDYARADSAIDDSLAALNLGYIDLMLIHQPGARDEEVYKALERGVRDGKIRSIGISNYYTPQDFERIQRIAEITPAVVQNENHPYYQNTNLQEYLKQYNTVVEAWYPFGGRGNTEKILQNETVKKIATAHGKTSAQIVLRWQIQAGYIVIPGSSNPAHIAENADIFDFELTADEMRDMAGLDKQSRFENW